MRNCLSRCCLQCAVTSSIVTPTYAEMLFWLYGVFTRYIEKCFSPTSSTLLIRKCIQNHEALVPDAVEVINDFLLKESDASCKRNAFMMLCSISQVRFYSFALLINFSLRASLWLTFLFLY